MQDFTDKKLWNLKINPDFQLFKKSVRICQIDFVQMSRSAEQPYNGKYCGQSGATPSRLEVDPEFT